MDQLPPLRALRRFLEELACFRDSTPAKKRPPKPHIVLEEVLAPPEPAGCSCPEDAYQARLYHCFAAPHDRRLTVSCSHNCHTDRIFPHSTPCMQEVAARLSVPTEPCMTFFDNFTLVPDRILRLSRSERPAYQVLTLRAALTRGVDWASLAARQRDTTFAARALRPPAARLERLLVAAEGLGESAGSTEQVLACSVMSQHTALSWYQTLLQAGRRQRP